VVDNAADPRDAGRTTNVACTKQTYRLNSPAAVAEVMEASSFAPSARLAVAAPTCPDRG
jgi:hypothetical protein